jgi:hypothetical protein
MIIESADTHPPNPVPHVIGLMVQRGWGLKVGGRGQEGTTTDPGA